MKTARLLASTALVLATLSGCNSTPNTNASKMGMNIPDWVTNAVVEKGLAAASCVAASNSFSLDKSQAATQARNELAQQIQTRVASLVEEYSKKTSNADDTTSNTSFISTITQFTNQALQGSKITKVDYAQMGDQRNLCALVTISENDSKALFKQIMKSAPVELDPSSEALMYLNFLKSENTSS